MIAGVLRRLLRLRHVVDVVPALSAVAEVAASRTDLESFILRLTLQVCANLVWLALAVLPDCGKRAPITVLNCGYSTLAWSEQSPGDATAYCRTREHRCPTSILATYCRLDGSIYVQSPMNANTCRGCSP